MIVSFSHKGLKKFFHTGSTAAIQAKHATKLQLILKLLDRAECVEDMNFNGSHLHELKGKLKGHWSVRVSGNWRVIFRFKGSDAEAVDYLDYH